MSCFDKDHLNYFTTDFNKKKNENEKCNFFVISFISALYTCSRLRVILTLY